MEGGESAVDKEPRPSQPINKYKEATHSVNDWVAAHHTTEMKVRRWNLPWREGEGESARARDSVVYMYMRKEEGGKSGEGEKAVVRRERDTERERVSE